jgi:hypothetical protein
MDRGVDDLHVRWGLSRPRRSTSANPANQFTSAGAARLHIHSFLDVTQTVFLPSKPRLDQKPSIMGWQIQFSHQRLDSKIIVLVMV